MFAGHQLRTAGSHRYGRRRQVVGRKGRAPSPPLRDHMTITNKILGYCLCLVVGVLLLVGCGSNVESGTSVAPVTQVDEASKTDTAAPSRVEWTQIADNEWTSVWNLDDGKLFCVFTQYQSDTLSCNWQ